MRCIEKCHLVKMYYLSAHSPGFGLDAGAEDTADMLLFMDQLFDSVNGSSVVCSEGKKLRCAVTSSSKHEEFWGMALKVLSSMEFHCLTSRRKFVPPSVRHWMDSIRGFQFLSKSLRETGFKFISLRSFNQDPLENFFGCIRSQGVRNVNPNTTSFTAAFKTLLLSNFLSPHSLGANCEEDSSDGALDTLRDFIFKDDKLLPVQSVSLSPETSQNEMVGPKLNCEQSSSQSVNHCEAEIKNNVMGPHFENEINVQRKRIRVAVDGYISGYVAKEVYAVTKNCDVCKTELIAVIEQPEHDFIIARRYTPKSLCLPHTGFVKLCKDIIDIIQIKIPSECHKNNISQRLFVYINEEIKLCGLSCSIHNVKELTIKLLTKIMLHAWVRNVNRILLGIVNAGKSNDTIKMQAHLYSQKYRHFRKALRKIE